MILADHEKDSPVWIKIKAHLESRIALLRLQNDSNMDEIDTATIRGQIRECKALLAQADDPIKLN